jgi:hypothetical protein
MNNLFYNILFIYSIYLHQLPSVGKKKSFLLLCKKKNLLKLEFCIRWVKKNNTFFYESFFVYFLNRKDKFLFIYYLF